MKAKFLKWTLRIALGTALLLVMVLITGFLYENSKRKSVKNKYPAPGKMINVDGHQIHVRFIGQGDVTIIMDAGLGELGSFGFLPIETQLAKHAQILLYDRAGCNWSEKSSTKRTPDQIAKELNQVVKQLQITGPVILVGHSQGGLNMMRYAALYRNEVNGLVLLDAAHPDSYSKMPLDVRETLMSAMGNISVVNTFAKVGILRMLMPKNAMQLPTTVENINNDSIAILLTDFFPKTMNECIHPEHNDSVVNHGLSMSDLQLDSLPVRILAATGSMEGPMGPPPGWNDDLEKKHIQYWSEMQQGLLALSTNSEILVLNEGGHAMQFTQSDTVISKILALVEKLSSNPENK